MALKRLHSQTYGEQVTPNKATKFTNTPPSTSKFDSPRLFDPRYQSNKVQQEHGDDDDVEVDPDFTDDEDDEKPHEDTKDKTYRADDDEYSSDEDNDDETDESYSEDDGIPHDSGYDTATASIDEEEDCSPDAPQECRPRDNVLQLKNQRTHNITYWLKRNRFEVDFPDALILTRCSFTHEQLQEVLELVQPRCLTLSQYTPADGFWGVAFRILGEQELRFLKVKCRAEEMGWKVARRSGKAVERAWPNDGLDVTMRGYDTVEIGTEDMQKQFEELAGRSATMF